MRIHVCSTLRFLFRTYWFIVSEKKGKHNNNKMEQKGRKNENKEKHKNKKQKKINYALA